MLHVNSRSYYVGKKKKTGKLQLFGWWHTSLLLGVLAWFALRFPSLLENCIDFLPFFGRSGTCWKCEAPGFKCSGLGGGALQCISWQVLRRLLNAGLCLFCSIWMCFSCSVWLDRVIEIEFSSSLAILCYNFIFYSWNETFFCHANTSECNRITALSQANNLFLKITCKQVQI